MKIKLLILTILFWANNFAQTYTTIKDLDDESYNQEGVYYKDIYNVLDPFVGTYLYSNGNTSFKIVLQKKLLCQGYLHYYDAIIGGYKYVLNGTVKVNTLDILNTTYPIMDKYKIHGRNIITGRFMCPACDPNEKWISASISDPANGSWDKLHIRKTMINGQEAIKIFIVHELWLNTEPNLEPIGYPIGQEFILIKQ